MAWTRHSRQEEYCVTVMTRQGRDGTLGYISLKSGEVTPAVAFDTGFVDGYLKQDPLPENVPIMETVLPYAEKCLANIESKCQAAGYALGRLAGKGKQLVPIH
jgi:hypothetical protein